MLISPSPFAAASMSYGFQRSCARLRKPGHNSTSDISTWQTWRVGRFLGEGGFGEVHQQVSEDEHHDFHYRAVKEFKQKTMQARRIDYKRELSVLAAFSNSEYSGFFVNLHGWWIASGKVFIAMEYLRYGDLSRYATVGISEAESKEITKNVLRGLEVMHKHDYTHRDIKPQNVLVVQKRPEFPTWWVKIADFGISKQIFEDSDTALRTTVGSQGYCAPEVLGYLESHQHISDYTSKVDVWSLGCVVFYICSQGQTPFTDPELMKYCDGRGSFNPRNHPVNLKDSGISFVLALLQVQPERRPTPTEALQHPWLTVVDTTAFETKSTVPLKSILTPQQNFNSFLSSAPATASLVHHDRTEIAVGSAVIDSPKRKPVGLSEFQSSPQQNFNSFLSSAPPTTSLLYRDRTDQTTPPAVAANIEKSSPGSKIAPRTLTKERDDNTQNPFLPSQSSPSLPVTVSQTKQAQQATESPDLLKMFSTVTSGRPKLGMNTNAFNSSTGLVITAEELQSEHVKLDVWLEKNKYKIWEYARFGRTPLHLAAEQGNLEVVIHLVRQGADIHAKDKSGGILTRADIHTRAQCGYTPFYMAITNGHFEVANWLKEQGADIHAESEMGSLAPLQHAARKGQLEVMRWLKEQGADINAKDENGDTLLHSAVCTGQLEVVKWLKEQGVDINARDNNGRTPLHEAIYSGRLGMVKWLSEHGADLRAKDNSEGHTPLRYAVHLGRKEIAEWLGAESKEETRHNTKFEQERTKAKMGTTNRLRKLWRPRESSLNSTPELTWITTYPQGPDPGSPPQNGSAIYSTY